MSGDVAANEQPRNGNRQRLIGRVAARLHAADLGVELSSEKSHSDWLCIGQPVRDYWRRLATEVVEHLDNDKSWATLHPPVTDGRASKSAEGGAS